MWWLWLACSPGPGAPGPLPEAAPTPDRVAPEPNAGNQILIRSARVRAMPPGSTTTAVFMVLENEGDAPFSLMSATAETSGAVEIHEHRADEEGVMQMRRIPRLEVPAHGTTTLEPGGFHLMLVGLVEPLNEGDTLGMTLRFDDESDLSTVVPVVAIREAEPAE